MYRRYTLQIMLGAASWSSRYFITRFINKVIVISSFNLEEKSQYSHWTHNVKDTSQCFNQAKALRVSINGMCVRVWARGVNFIQNISHDSPCLKYPVLMLHLLWLTDWKVIHNTYLSTYSVEWQSHPCNILVNSSSALSIVIKIQPRTLYPPSLSALCEK